MTPDTDTIVDQLSSLLTSTLTSLQTPEFLEFKSGESFKIIFHHK